MDCVHTSHYTVSASDSSIAAAAPGLLQCWRCYSCCCPERHLTDHVGDAFGMNCGLVGILLSASPTAR